MVPLSRNPSERFPMFNALFGTKRQALITVVAWVLLIGELSAFAPAVKDVQANGNRTAGPGAASFQAQQLIDDHFPDAEALSAIITVRGASRMWRRRWRPSIRFVRTRETCSGSRFNHAPVGCPFRRTVPGPSTRRQKLPEGTQKQQTTRSGRTRSSCRSSTAPSGSARIPSAGRRRTQ